MKEEILSERSKRRSERLDLKFQLSRERAVFVPKYGMRPVCAICGKPIMESPDMHEGLITKAQGPYLPSEVLNCRENCVLTHPGGKSGVCHAMAHTENGYEYVAWHLYGYEGLDTIARFFVRARGYSKLNDIEPALRFGFVLIGRGIDSSIITASLLAAGW